MNNDTIKSLTKEQEKQLVVYKEKWLKLAFATTTDHRIDRNKVELAVNALYDKVLKLSPPTIIFVSSPTQLFEEVKKEFERRSLTYNSNIESNVICGTYEANWVSTYDYITNVLNVQIDNIQYFLDLVECTGIGLYFEDCCFVSERLVHFRCDNDFRLHDLEGPAVEYEDGTKKYFVHGIQVDEYVIMEPEKITVQDILGEQNIEIRRLKIDQYGADKFVIDSGGKLIDSSSFGELFLTHLDGDEDICVVRVINSTSEPDGTFKKYLLRVPPNITTAKEAVAWTFHENEDMYNPTVEA